MFRYVLLTALLMPVSAPADTTTDAVELEACLGAVGSTDKADERGCVGRVSDACQVALTDPTTFTRADCVLREQNAWEALRDRYFEELHEAASEVARITLREAQRRWSEFRHWDCAALNDLTSDKVVAREADRMAAEDRGGGLAERAGLSEDDMIRHLAISACLRDHMAERALRLREFLARSR